MSPKKDLTILPTLNPLEKLDLYTICFLPLTVVYWKHHTWWTTLCPHSDRFVPQGEVDDLAGMQRVFVGFSAQSQCLQNQNVQLSKTGQENWYIIMFLQMVTVNLWEGHECRKVWRRCCWSRWVVHVFRRLWPLAPLFIARLAYIVRSLVSVQVGEY